VVAGYGGHRRASTAEPVFARAIALEAGGARAYLAVIDTLLIPGELEEEVLRRAGLPPDTCVMLAATHTHSGPGGAWDSVIAGWAGAGAFDRAQRDAIAQAAAAALQKAAAALGPAEIRIAREEWPQGPARARSDGPIDDELVALRLQRPGGAEVATLVDYAMHPTSAAHDRISPDWPGFVPALVVQGAVGNTTWPRDAPLAAPVAVESARLLADAPARSTSALSCETRIFALPPPRASPRVPFLLRRAFANVFALGMDAFAVQTRLQIDALSLLGVPGEPVGELGLAARPEVLVGLADGYLGYVETPERWQAGQGESAKTYFGPGLAHALGLWPR
jgi:neutral ceramidase